MVWKEGLTYDMKFRPIGGILDQREEEGTKRRQEGSMGEMRNQQADWGSSWEEGGTNKKKGGINGWNEGPTGGWGSYGWKEGPTGGLRVLWEERRTNKEGWANERNWKGNYDLLDKRFIYIRMIPKHSFFISPSTVGVCIMDVRVYKQAALDD